MALRCGSQLVGIEATRGADLMQTCGQIVAHCRRQQAERVVLDAVGLGAGVLDRLRELQREGEPTLAGVEPVGFESGAGTGHEQVFQARTNGISLDTRHHTIPGHSVNVPTQISPPANNPPCYTSIRRS
jgi:hypothetical protein